MITRLRQRPGRRRLRAGSGDAGLLRVARRAHMRHFAAAGYWASATHHGAGPGALLPARGPARAEAQPRLRPPPARVDRVATSAGASPATPSAPATGRSSRAAGAAPPPGGSCTRRRCSSAGARRFAMAVLTDGNPTHDYGTETLRGVAARIFGGGRRPPRTRRGHPRRPCDAPGLEDVLDRAPGHPRGAGLRQRRTTSPAGRCPATAAPGPTCCARRPRSGAGCSARLRRAGHGLLVLDAYRPARASRALVRWARRSGRPELVGTYIAQRSRHNLGSAVDLTLVRLRDGRRLRMGTGYDHLGPRAHTLAAQRPAAAQPARAQGGDGAARLQRLLARVVALRAPRARRRPARPHPGVSAPCTRDNRAMSELLRVALAQIDPKVGDIPAMRARSPSTRPAPASAARRWWCSRSWRSPATRRRTCS